MRKLLVLLLVLALRSIVRAQEPVTIPPVPPAPGELVDVGGYRLHLYCVGEGSPTVILEPGFARFSVNMRTLQSTLAESNRVCAYDHAGYGWSEPGTFPRTAQQLTDELAALLDARAVEQPYIVVAHSFGGFVARLFAAQHADVTAGVILLDATPPEFLSTPETQPSDQMLETILQVTTQTAQAGQWNQQTIAPVMQLMNDVPPELQPDFLALATRPEFLEAALSEWQNRQASAKQVIDAGALSETPLTVLVAGDRLALESELDSVWLGGQLAQAELSTHSELAFAVGGDHDFYITQPEIIARAIRRMAAEW